MEKNPRTWAAVRARFAGADKGTDAVLNALENDPEHADSRYVLVTWEGIEGHGDTYVGGAWTTLEDLAQSYDWRAGTPEYAIDLAAAPEEALVGLGLVIKPSDLRDTLENQGIEFEERP